METYKGRILRIESIGKEEYKVLLDVYNDSEVEQILNFENDKDNFVLHTNNLEFIVDRGSMVPVGEAEECMNVYHSYETPDNLNPRLRRQWLTANIIDNISCNLITSDSLKIYSTEEED